MIAFGLLFFNNNSDRTGSVHAVTIELLGIASSPWMWLKNFVDVQDENEYLRKQNARLFLENSRLAEAKLENTRLRRIIGLNILQKFDCVAAKVIGRNRAASINTILIDAGKKQGVERNMPVISGQGLVGKIIAVSANHATCQILTDRNFRAAARIQRTRIAGLYRSEGDKGGTVIGVPVRADVQQADIVVTSGMNSIFPPGLTIGRVEKIEESPDKLYKIIWVSPQVDFNKIEEVFVIRSNLSQVQ